MQERKHKQQTSALLLTELKKRYPDLKQRSANKALVAVLKREIEGGLNENTLKQAFGILTKLIPAASPGHASQQALMQQIRAAVVSKYGRDSVMHKKSLTLMRFNQDLWKQDKKVYEHKVSLKNANRRQFKDIDIYKVMDTVKASDDLASLVVGAQLASGARLTEILSVGKFESVKDKPNYVKQTGLSKRKPGDTKARNTVIKPIVHYTVKEFLGMVKKIRNLVKSNKKTGYELSSSLNARINRKIKSLFEDDTTKSHVLRKIYGNLSYDLFADKKTTSMASWLSNVLGHKEGNLTVSLSYSTVNVEEVKEEIKEEVEEKKELKVEVPRNNKKRDGKAQERAEASINALVANGEIPTARKLRNLGFGARSAAVAMVKHREP